MKIAFDLSPVLGDRTGVEYYALRLYKSIKEYVGVEAVVPFSNHPIPEVPETIVLNPALPVSLWRQILPCHFRRYGITSYHSPVTAVPYFSPVPTFATVHDMCFLQDASPAEKRRQLFACRMAARCCKRIFCVSNATREALCNQIRKRDASKCITNHSGALLRESVNPVKPTVPAKYLLQIGRIDKRKNPILVLNAFAESGIADRFHFVFAGSFGDASTEVEHWLERHPEISSHVICTGYLSEKRLAGYLQGASALVYPSRDEGFGHPPFEALAFGVVPIVSDIPVLRETLGDGAAIFASLNDANAWVEAFQTVAAPSFDSSSFVDIGQLRIDLLPWDFTAQNIIKIHDESL